MTRRSTRTHTSCFRTDFRKRIFLPLIFLLPLGFYIMLMYSVHLKRGVAVNHRNEHLPSLSSKITEHRFEKDKLQRLVILGAGPTGLGVAYRLYEQGVLRTNTQVVILERQMKPGGLAMSHRDKAGFLWDNGGHVVFSHYDYFTKLLDKAVSEWNKHERAAYAFMKGSSGRRSFIPYPVQDNVFSFDKRDRERIIEDLEKLNNEQRYSAKRRSANFDEWLVNNFGNVLSGMFMRKFNKKVWTVDPKLMNAVWVGERVAIPNLEKMKKECLNSEDSKWGPNYFFRYPRYGGTGGIWQAVSDLLPRCWFHYGHKVIGVDLSQKRLEVRVDDDPKLTYFLNYDILITTAQLDAFVNMDQNKIFEQQRQLANELVFSVTHIVGIGLKGQPVKELSNKSWIYFPDSDSPFYRATVFSMYSSHHTPHPETQWSLMCECAQPMSNVNLFWTEKYVVEETIIALIKYGFIKREQILSTFYHRLDHGYPIPSISRERVLSVIQPWLESNNVFSRGRFGGWRYEVGNQDHSLMQGVEIADFILKGVPEETYSNPSLVNSMKASNRTFRNPVLRELVPDYEIILAHYNEDLTWLAGNARYCHIYHKGNSVIPDFRLRKWEILPNIGRESHTYLHHIIKNYERLANVTLFLQAGAYNHTEFVYQNLSTYYEEAKHKGFSAKGCSWWNGWGYMHFNIPGWRNTTHKGPGSPFFRKAKLSLGRFWRVAFKRNHPGSIIWCPAACFAVTRELILKNPISFYKKLITYVEDSRDPEEGHYVERVWRTGVFSFFPERH